MAKTITIELTDSQYKAMEICSASPEDWAENAVLNRSRIQLDEVTDILVKHCNDNSLDIPSGQDNQLSKALELGIVKTAKERNEEAEKNTPPK